jgi:hypothetical protein
MDGHLFIQDLDLFLQTQTLEEKIAEWWRRYDDVRDERLLKWYGDGEPFNGAPRMLAYEGPFVMNSYARWMEKQQGPVKLPNPALVMNAFKLVRSDPDSIRVMVIESF